MDLAGMEYTIVKAGRNAVAEIMPPPPKAHGKPAMWGAYLTVEMQTKPPNGP